MNSERLKLAIERTGDFLKEKAEDIANDSKRELSDLSIHVYFDEVYDFVSTKIQTDKEYML